MCTDAHEEHEEQYIDISKVAALMDSSIDTVKRMIERGELEAVIWSKTHKITRASFQRYLETHRVQAKDIEHPSCTNQESNHRG